jgi:hypothetical protein
MGAERRGFRIKLKNNKMKKILLVLLIWSCQAVGTNSKVDNLEGWLPYENSQIGWNIQYPSNYSIMPQSEIDMIENRGLNALENSTGENIEKNYENLLWIRGAGMNGLTSVLQDNSSFTDNEIIQEEEEADSLMIQSIRNQGIRMEYKFDSEEIDNLNFKTFKAKYFSREGKVFLNQKTFDHYFDNKQVLSITINYTTDSIGMELERIVQTSKFIK